MENSVSQDVDQCSVVSGTTSGFVVAAVPDLIQFMTQIPSNDGGHSQQNMCIGDREGSPQFPSQLQGTENRKCFESSQLLPASSTWHPSLQAGDSQVYPILYEEVLKTKAAISYCDGCSTSSNGTEPPSRQQDLLSSKEHLHPDKSTITVDKKCQMSHYDPINTTYPHSGSQESCASSLILKTVFPSRSHKPADGINGMSSCLKEDNSKTINYIQSCYSNAQEQQSLVGDPSQSEFVNQKMAIYQCQAAVSATFEERGLTSFCQKKVGATFSVKDPAETFFTENAVQACFVEGAIGTSCIQDPAEKFCTEDAVHACFVEGAIGTSCIQDPAEKFCTEDAVHTCFVEGAIGTSCIQNPAETFFTEDAVQACFVEGAIGTSCIQDPAETSCLEHLVDTSCMKDTVKILLLKDQAKKFCAEGIEKTIHKEDPGKSSMKDPGKLPLVEDAVNKLQIRNTVESCLNEPLKTFNVEEPNSVIPCLSVLPVKENSKLSVKPKVLALDASKDTTEDFRKKSLTRLISLYDKMLDKINRGCSLDGKVHLGKFEQVLAKLTTSLEKLWARKMLPGVTQEEGFWRDKILESQMLLREVLDKHEHLSQRIQILDRSETKEFNATNLHAEVNLHNTTRPVQTYSGPVDIQATYQETAMGKFEPNKQESVHLTPFLQSAGTGPCGDSNDQPTDQIFSHYQNLDLNSHVKRLSPPAASPCLPASVDVHASSGAAVVTAHGDSFGHSVTINCDKDLTGRLTESDYKCKKHRVGILKLNEPLPNSSSICKCPGMDITDDNLHRSQESTVPPNSEDRVASITNRDDERCAVSFESTDKSNCILGIDLPLSSTMILSAQPSVNTRKDTSIEDLSLAQTGLKDCNTRFVNVHHIGNSAIKHGSSCMPTVNNVKRLRGQPVIRRNIFHHSLKTEAEEVPEKIQIIDIGMIENKVAWIQEGLPKNETLSNKNPADMCSQSTIGVDSLFTNQLRQQHLAQPNSADKKEGFAGRVSSNSVAALTSSLVLSDLHSAEPTKQIKELNLPKSHMFTAQDSSIEHSASKNLMAKPDSLCRSCSCDVPAVILSPTRSKLTIEALRDKSGMKSRTTLAHDHIPACLNELKIKQTEFENIKTVITTSSAAENSDGYKLCQTQKETQILNLNEDLSMQDKKDMTGYTDPKSLKNLSSNIDNSYKMNVIDSTQLQMDSLLYSGCSSVMVTDKIVTKIKEQQLTPVSSSNQYACDENQLVCSQTDSPSTAASSSLFALLTRKNTKRKAAQELPHTIPSGADKSVLCVNHQKQMTASKKLAFNKISMHDMKNQTVSTAIEGCRPNVNLNTKPLMQTSRNSKTALTKAVSHNNKKTAKKSLEIIPKQRKLGRPRKETPLKAHRNKMTTSGQDSYQNKQEQTLITNFVKPKTHRINCNLPMSFLSNLATAIPNPIHQTCRKPETGQKKNADRSVPSLMSQLQFVYLIADEEITGTGTDFPVNFWNEDFANIRMSTALWDSVDSWT